jgi:P pilus assembly chaperone PapD
MHQKKNARLAEIVFGVLLSLLLGVSAWAEFLPGQTRLVQNAE